jgi:D-alanyl-D-alanine carboxypeptidase/D-alanyl-D-alanine-endopeptidase (penicillin-binding protein 4)
MTGILVETLEGQPVMEQLANIGFNPASAVKLATALAALRTFGPEHRFTTAVWTTGTLDKATGTINGDLIISGRDPSFHYEHAVMLARELNRIGVRTVTGDLIVAPRFTMNFSVNAQRSGDALYDTLDATRRPAAAARAWVDERIALNDSTSLQTVPSVAVMGAVYVDSVPKGARPLLTHSSSKLVDVLKVLLCYSNNFMAERIGDTLGGPEGVRRVAIRDAGVNPAEISLATTSGLGVNRVTPRAMMRIFRALRDELAKTNLSPSDIMPVAGVDPGTLQKRYTSYPSRGSVIAKTGTLIRTDGGVSALVGQMRTARGETLLFVIFNQRGSFLRFRESQDMLITQLQNQRGGPLAFNYKPLTLSMRLADTEQSAVTTVSDEYEPGQQ